MTYLLMCLFIIGVLTVLGAKCLENGSVNILKNFYCVPV